MITAAVLVTFMTENYLTQRMGEGESVQTRWFSPVLGKARPSPLSAPLLQLLLPAQHPSLVAFRLGLGNHSFLLIQDREAGVRQNIVGIDVRDLSGNFDGFVEAGEVLQRPAQSVQRVGELRISRHRLPVLFDRLLVVAFKNQIERSVIVVFGQLAGLFALN